MTRPGPAERRLLADAARPRKRRARPVFLAEGERVVADLLASGVGVRLVAGTSSFVDSEAGRAVTGRAEERGVPVRRLDASEVAGFATTETPQPVLAVGEIPPHGLDDALAGDPVRPPVALVLDGVQDPGNAGTLVRTAEALGAASVIALPGSVDLWNPKVVRAAAGSLFRLPVARPEGGAAEAVATIREAGFELLLAAADGEPVEAPPGGPAALVVGNEGAGVREHLFSPADRRVAVRMRGPAESLNVAAAAAILLHQLSR